MNAHVHPVFRGRINAWAASGGRYVAWARDAADELARAEAEAREPELCPCGEDITDVAVRCEGCRGRFCLNCVALCDRYAVCATCAPAQERELVEAGDDPVSLAAIRRFMGGEQIGRAA